MEVERRSPLAAFERPALLLVDLQCLFIDPKSPGYLSDWSVAAPHCRKLLLAFRRAGHPVIWSRHLNTTNDFSKVIAHFGGRPLMRDQGLSEFHEDWIPEKREPIIEKRGYSAFRDTQLTQHLLGTDLLIIAGVTTNRCVTATAIDCALSDRLCAVAADATAARRNLDHNAALRVLASGFCHVSLTQELLRSCATR